MCKYDFQMTFPETHNGVRDQRGGIRQPAEMTYMTFQHHFKFFQDL